MGNNPQQFIVRCATTWQCVVVLSISKILLSFSLLCLCRLHPSVLEGIDLESEIATLDSYESESGRPAYANKKHRFR